MAYVRSLRFERVSNDKVIRVYVVETPRWYRELSFYDVDVSFPKLVELELHISRECADYFRKVPYNLAETIWVEGLCSECCRPFCCTYEYAVLFYPREPDVSRMVELDRYHNGPVVLAVTLRPDVRDVDWRTMRLKHLWEERYRRRYE